MQWFILGFLFWFAPCLYGAEVLIEEFSVHVSHRTIEVTVHLSPNIPREVLKPLESGLPVTFVYHFWLKSPRRYWKDKTWQKRDIYVKVKHDPVKMEYHISYSDEDRLLLSKTVFDWHGAIAALTSLENWQIFTLGDQVTKEKLYVQCQVYLSTRITWLFFPDNIESEVVLSSLFTPHD